MKSSFLWVIPTLEHYSDMVSKFLTIPSGSVYINIWHIHVAIPSDIFSCIYIDILSDIRSGIYILRCFLAYILTFFPAYYLASFWHSLWLFFWHSIWHLFWRPFFLAFYLTFPLASGWGPAVLTEIWSSQDEGQEEEEEEATLIKSRDLHLAGGEHRGTTYLMGIPANSKGPVLWHVLKWVFIQLRQCFNPCLVIWHRYECLLIIQIYRWLSHDIVIFIPILYPWFAIIHCTHYFPMIFGMIYPSGSHNPQLPSASGSRQENAELQRQHKTEELRATMWPGSSGHRGVNGRVFFCSSILSS